MDKTPQQQHDWEHRGINPPRSNGAAKWETWLRVFLSFALGAFSAAFFLGGKSRDIDSLLKWQLEVQKNDIAVWDRINEMDRGGTSRSHWVDEQQSAQINANSARITELANKSEARGETINVMQGKIERIESELKGKP